MRQSATPLLLRSRSLLRWTVTLLCALTTAAPRAQSTYNSQWLSRDIPQNIQEILREDESASGLFAPLVLPEFETPRQRQDLTTSAAPATRMTKRPGATPSTTANVDTQQHALAGRSSMKGGHIIEVEELAPGPDALLRQPPASLGRIPAPASERIGVPDPVMADDGWTFRTPAQRVPSLNKHLQARGRWDGDLPTQLGRHDMLQAQDMPVEHWLEAARLHKLPAEALYAVALQESGLRTASGAVQPWPWTLNCNAPCPHGAMRFANRQAASDALKKLLKAGWRNIDIGAMQINYRTHAKRFSEFDLLDPRINVIVGGVILREAVAQARGNLRNGFGLYHVGVLQSDNAGRAEQYAARVTRWSDRIRQGGGIKLANR